MAQHVIPLDETDKQELHQMLIEMQTGPTKSPILKISVIVMSFFILTFSKSDWTRIQQIMASDDSPTNMQLALCEFADCNLKKNHI